MKKIENFTHQYSLSKTLRFSLVPQGETEYHFNNKLLLEEDEQRAVNYEYVKEYIDRYHAVFIESVLSELVLDNVKAYAALYYKVNKSDKEKKMQAEAEVKLRKDISKAFTSDVRYKSIMSADIIKNILPGFLTDEIELEIVDSFKMFTTYFQGFFKNRENLYVADEQATAIAYRCINENLPRFLDNAASFAQKISKELSDDDFETLSNDFSLLPFSVHDYFSIDFFNYVLPQSGIDSYNKLIGGYTKEDGTKIKGLNEYINLHNQHSPKHDRLPLLKPLYKQILTQGQSASFIVKPFKTADEVLNAIYAFYTGENDNGFSVSESIAKLSKVIEQVQEFDLSGIYIKSGVGLTTLSQNMFGRWNVFLEAWNDEYDAVNLKPGKERSEKYIEKRHKAYNGIKSFNMAELQQYVAHATRGENVETAEDIPSYYINAVKRCVENIDHSFSAVKSLLTTPYTDNIKLFKNKEAISTIKAFLDSIKELEALVKPLCGTGREEIKDDVFYGEFLPCYDNLAHIDKLYDRVRNYMTQKPYSKDKIKLNFQNPQLLGGWDRNKETAYRCVLLRKDGYYYLAIMDKSSSSVFETTPPATISSDAYEKMIYKLLPGPNKMLPKVFFSAKNIDFYAPSSQIIEIYKSGTFKKGESFNLSDCHKLIDFYKASIAKNPDWSQLGFAFAETEDYKDIGEFYNDVLTQGYKVGFEYVPSDYINTLVKEGKIYLFQIYSKDFSPFSKGTPNLHTLYFKALFEERNLSDVVYKLNGEAEIFYRRASLSLSDTTIHPKNQPLENKNPNNADHQSVFAYDIVKDRRFTDRQFSIHIPITMNFKTGASFGLDEKVRRTLKQSDETYVIGIDRGERNLIYVCVIDSKGNIVEQISLNEIVTCYSKADSGVVVENRVNYNHMLEEKAKKRDAERKSWNDIETIKELKEGYLSQVVNIICKLIVKYDAIVAMEDLNAGFKNSRIKFENQVYQKFEKMLIEKLNYLIADKKQIDMKVGGLYSAYQLTHPIKSFREMGRQNGFVFYVPPYLTSKIDPTTGFVNLFRLKYESVEKAQAFFNCFESIAYNEVEDVFEFGVDYSAFEYGKTDFTQKWTVCSYGDRIQTFRTPDGRFECRTVHLTEAFNELFATYNIDKYADIKEQICNLTDKEFFVKLIGLLSLMLQMRNSNKNTGEDYIISPVRNKQGYFFDSRYSDDWLPKDADANGAYHIALKALWAIDVLKATPEEELMKAKLSVSNKEWLEFAQGRFA